MSRILAVALLFFTSPALACQSVDGLPDPNCSPGAIDPRVTQENIGETICHPGYSKKQRPPVSVTNKMKQQVMQEYGMEGQDSKMVEGDHLVSIEAGGCPGPGVGCDFHANFWPEPWDGELGAHAKDRVENEIHREICSGEITLAEGQYILARNWVGCYRMVEQGKKCDYKCEGDECAP